MQLVRRIVRLVALSLALAPMAFATSGMHLSDITGANAGLMLSSPTVSTLRFMAGTGGRRLSGDVMFDGTFSGPVAWTLTTVANGTQNYTLASLLAGPHVIATIKAVTLKLTAENGRVLTPPISLTGGDNTIGSVPEPSSFALFGTGSLGLLGMIRRKLA